MSDEKKINNTKQLEINIDYLSTNSKPHTVELYDMMGYLRNRRTLTKDEKKDLQELLRQRIGVENHDNR